MKMKDDPKLEKLFEGMSKEQLKIIANQNAPSKRETAKKTTKKANGAKKSK